MIRTIQHFNLPEGYELLEWNDKQVSDYWSFISKVKGETYFTVHVGQNLLYGLRKYVNPSVKVFDLGAGQGTLIEMMLKRGISAGGFEMSAEGAARLNAFLGKYENFLGVIKPDQAHSHAKAYDVVLMTEIVEHLYDDQLDLALAMAHNLLKDGGHLIITTPNEEDLIKECVISPESGKVFHRWQHVRSWSANTLSSYLKKSGFSAVKSEVCNIYCWGFNLVAVRRKILDFLGRRPLQNLVVISRKVP
jgi:2-polyprenyl-3-methyl-5-hydroxy-6-metoxy-1,4-benzoquinol methylase